MTNFAAVTRITMSKAFSVGAAYFFTLELFPLGSRSGVVAGKRPHEHDTGSDPIVLGCLRPNGSPFFLPLHIQKIPTMSTGVRRVLRSRVRRYWRVCREIYEWGCCAVHGAKI